ncbi:response regulator receiver domain [Klenkia taihuensis]|uniref:Response receiver domain-containing protein n=1 Tax=Klenkia taihuensis TaxID=1225127 RepID=A0A1I1Q563_9ACTN|nr:response regulator receiver domain [Klenkia taihuensis]GHE08391.1 hypothetical protein GCM10011381_08990 [Klenkia taihuensis]SFD14363.1 hypothetical protein SAMN05661030_2476 [Klenkia taihuensis]
MTSTSVPRARAREIATHYLQTVVVVDDEISFDNSAVPLRLVTPDDTSDTPNEAADDVATAPVGRATARLDGRSIVESFAAQGLICALLSPKPGSTLKDQVLAVAQRADAFVLDWRMNGDDGRATLAIIKDLLGGDHRSRLRLICIYTHDIDLDSIQKKVADALVRQHSSKDGSTPHGVTALDAAQSETGTLGVRGPGYRISIIGKGSGARVNTKSATESELPDVLIGEFAAANHGLLRGLVLEALAVLRDNSSALVARFDVSLDAAYASHSVLTGDDGDFAVSIVVQQISALLEAAGVAGNVDRSAIGAWASEVVAQPNFTPLIARDQHEPQAVDADWVKTLFREIEVGPQEAIRSALKAATNGGQSIKRADLTFTDVASLTSVFAGSASDADRADHSFARLSCVARSHHDAVPEILKRGKAPVLRLGTVLRNGGTDGWQYWVCVMPLCDSVRVKGKRKFPLVPLHVSGSNSGSFDVALLDVDGTELRLQSSSHPYETSMPTFTPADSEVRAIWHAGKAEWRFEADGDRQTYIWLADLRPEHALRIAVNAAQVGGRIGLDESEWLRLNGRNRLRKNPQ